MGGWGFGLVFRPHVRNIVSSLNDGTVKTECSGQLNIPRTDLESQPTSAPSAARVQVYRYTRVLFEETLIFVSHLHRHEYVLKRQNQKSTDPRQSCISIFTAAKRVETLKLQEEITAAR